MNLFKKAALALPFVRKMHQELQRLRDEVQYKDTIIRIMRKDGYRTASNPELVRLAYQLILGREPESESVLDIEFDDVYALRDKFINSEEFLTQVVDFDNRTIKGGKTLIRNFEQYDEFARKYVNCDFDGLSYDDFLLKYQLDFNAFAEKHTQRQDWNPFSCEYRAWEISFFEFLSGRKYDVSSEGLSAQRDCDEGHIRPDLQPEEFFSAGYRIEHLRIYTDFVEIAAPMPDLRILEMGSGWGHFAEFIARFGCNITCLDACGDFIEYTRKRLSSQNLDARYIHGSFFDLEKDGNAYDMVVFDSSFHHCDDPVRLLNILHKKTADNCRVFFLREPIYEKFDRPWGVVRYDGETIMQMRVRGWLELGFRLDFFSRMLERTGFRLEKSYILNGSVPLLEVRKGIF